MNPDIKSQQACVNPHFLKAFTFVFMCRHVHEPKEARKGSQLDAGGCELLAGCGARNRT